MADREEELVGQLARIREEKARAQEAERQRVEREVQELTSGHFRRQQDAAFMADFANRFNAAPRDMYGSRLGLSNHDITRYTNARFGQHVREVFARTAWVTGRTDTLPPGLESEK